MDFQSLMERLQGMFRTKQKSEIEQYIESKNPKTASDIEHWMQQWTYNNTKYLGF